LKKKSVIAQIQEAMASNDEYKQVIIVRNDLKLSCGKTAVQVAHASILGFERSDKQTVEKWKMGGQKKIVLQTNLKKMMELKNNADNEGITSGIIKDAGLTEIPPGTITCIVLGPDKSSKIDKLTGSLPLLSD